MPFAHILTEGLETSVIARIRSGHWCLLVYRFRQVSERGTLSLAVGLSFMEVKLRLSDLNSEIFFAV